MSESGLLKFRVRLYRVEFSQSQGQTAKWRALRKKSAIVPTAAQLRTFKDFALVPLSEVARLASSVTQAPPQK